ncbi:MAG: hypothetical protein QM775_12090 [Pirellulales bacterium]
MARTAVDAADYNKLLADGAERILPAKVGQLVETPQYKLNPLKYEHALVAEFRGSQQGNLLNTPVYRYYRLDLKDRPLARPVLEFLNEAKDPFLVAETIGKGALCSSPPLHKLRGRRCRSARASCRSCRRWCRTPQEDARPKVRESSANRWPAQFDVRRRRPRLT